MIKVLKFRGGTTAKHSTFTGSDREITVDTDKDTLVVHDGATVGGFAIARESVVNTALDTKVNKNTNITASTNTKITYDAKGLVTGGTTLAATDIPSLDASKVTTGILPVLRGGTGVSTSTGTGNIVFSTSPSLSTPNIGVASGTSFNSITGLASVAPLASGTAAVGVSTLTARQDHIHPIQTTVSGNAGTATILSTSRNITLSGDASGTASFNGSADASIVVVVADNSHAHTIANVTGLQTALDNKVDDIEKGSANGVATLDVNGKVTLTQIPDSVLGQLEYQSVWDFTTLPTAIQKGQYWIASVAGNGYLVGDWAVWNGLSFDKVDNTDAVASVAGRTGNVVLTKADVGLDLVDNIADVSKNVLSATKLTTTRNIALTGDVTGSVNFDGSVNVSIATTIGVNSVALGTDTTGNYVVGNTAGTGISITGTAGEGWSPTITNTAPNVTTDITTTHNATNVVVNSSDGTDGTINGATQTLAGVMTAADKSKLDGIATGATANVGTVTSIATSGAITGGTVTSSGTISHSTADGYLHVPATGTINSGKVLTAGATAGSISWQTIPAGVTDHILLTNIGTNTHAQIDTALTRLVNTSGTNTGDNAVNTNYASDYRAANFIAGTNYQTPIGTITGIVKGNGSNSLTSATVRVDYAEPTTALATGILKNTTTTGVHSIAVAGTDYLLPNGSAASLTSFPTLNQNTTGSAATLTIGRTIGMTGDVTWTSASFNGAGNVTGVATLSNSGVTAGTYSKVTVDSKGRITSGSTPTMEDIPDATFKRSAKVATTANITLSAPQTIDGIAVVAGDRVLVKDQTTSSQNGIYVVAAGAWTRALDADTASKIASALVAVDSGTVNGGKLFDNDFKTTDTLGTTAMPWAFNLDSGSLSSTTPLVAGTAAIGTGTTVARADHVHPAQATITGNAGTATMLQTARTISGVSFDGSANIEIEDRLGTALASAATTTIGTRGLGDYIHITGVATITSLGTAAAAGIRRTLIFDGALTLTHNATSLICPGAANIVTVSGTIIEVVSETTANWRVVSITHPSLGMLELGYLDGVTSAIQAQINLKAPLNNPVFTSAISTRDVNYKSTPISVTSWSYVTTTITLNVASHTFVAGDYIEVLGLTSTTHPANGIHLVTSVTSTTIIFTLGATPTGTAGVSSATVKGITTLNGKIISEDIGINQSWQLITRLSDTNYSNTSNRMIKMVVYVTAGLSDGQINVIITPIGSTTAITIPIGVTGSNNGDCVFNFSIPAGCTYKIAPSYGTVDVAAWYEFR